MSPAPDQDAAVGDEPSRTGPEGRDAARRRRRRLAEVFGETLPDRTGDGVGDGWGEQQESGGHDDWLRGQVPPHHG